MKNFKVLLSRELQSQLKSFSFAVMIPVALVVSLLVSNLQLNSYKDRRRVYDEQQQQSREQLDNVYFYSQLKVDVYMPPTVLSVFAKGLDESIGNKITVSALDVPELQTTSQRGNAFIRLFNSIDISGIVKILSIFIVLMAACPIAQDREEGTGKLTFANSIGFLEYYLSKYAALMVVAAMMVAVTFLVPVAWMIFDPQVGLSAATVGSILLMMLSGILYLSVFVLISLAISAASPKISVATLTSLMVWVTLVYIYPFTVNSVIDKTITVPSDKSVKEQLDKMDNDLEREFFLYVKEHNMFEYGSSICHSISLNYHLISEQRVALKEHFEQTKKGQDFLLPKISDLINQTISIRENQKSQQLRKKRLFDRFMFFIPDQIYQTLCEQAAGTCYEYREKQFTEKARIYRSTLTDYIQSKNGFSNTFFTQMPESEMRNSYEEYSQADIDRYCKLENLTKINSSEIPQFNMPRRPVNVATWAGLLLLNLIFGSLSIWIYHRFLSFK